MSSHASKPSKPRHPLMPPKWMFYVLPVVLVLHAVPFAWIAVARTNKDKQPRAHFFQDMDNQPRFKAQSTNPLYADTRAMRAPVPGTVRRGHLDTDDHYHRGYRTDAEGRPILVEVGGKKDYDWIDGYPSQVTVNEELLRRGRQRYDIFCTPCHGASGNGNGMVHQRALLRGAQSSGWVQPANLVAATDGVTNYSTKGSSAMPDGKMYHTIAYGAGTMRGYAQQINVHDRWAIVAYIRALQLSQNARVGDVPTEAIPQLR